MTPRFVLALCGVLAAAGLFSNALLAAPKVAVTIKPVHALVAGVMGNLGAPALIWSGAASPHNASLKPSQVHALQSADVIFHIGPGLETALQAALAERARSGAMVVSLLQAPNLTILPLREGGIWQAHDHADSHDEGHADDHDDEPAGHDQDHAVPPSDPHIWLDPQNGKALALHVSAVLAEVDPDNAETYRTNAAELIIQLNALGREISANLAPVKSVPFLVFHDAYQYFERRFDLNSVGAITIDPGHRPGARRLKELKDEITGRKAACVFAEPQVRSRLCEDRNRGHRRAGGNARSARLDDTRGQGSLCNLAMVHDQGNERMPVRQSCRMSATANPLQGIVCPVTCGLS